MIRTIIIENELPAIKTMQRLLRPHSDVEIIAICSDIQTSLLEIQSKKPDLVFMDVLLNNEENAFQILKSLTSIDFELIVTTSFNKFAKQACQASSLDFLEKPFSQGELTTALEKYRIRRNKALDMRQIELFLSVLQGNKAPLKYLIIPTMKGNEYADISQVVYFEAEGSQTRVFFNDQKNSIIVNKKMKDLEELYRYGHFQRIHKSYLINLNYVKSHINRGKDGEVKLKADSLEKILPVSREHKNEFLNRLSKF